MSHSLRPMSIHAMIRRGLAGLRRYSGLWLSLYLVQFITAALGTWIMTRILAAELASNPVFDRAVDGDPAALAFILGDNPGVFAATMAVGVGVAVGYALLSWYLVGGAVAVLLRQPGSGRDLRRCFGAGGAETFFAYARLWLWSLIPYAIGIIALALGFYLGGKDLIESVTIADVLGQMLPPLIPAVVIFWLHLTAIDYARIELSRRALAGEPLSALRALLGAYRAVLGDRRPLLHIAIYAGYFFAVSAVYVTLGQGAAMAGVIGAVAIFLIRQLVLALRFAADVVCTAGQVALVGSRVSPAPDSAPGSGMDEA